MLNEINEKYDREQAEWESARSTLEKRCSDVEAESEERQLDLLVAQVKLMQAEGETNGTITDLRKTLAETRFRMSMGEERIRAILKRHKVNTLKMFTEFMDKG